VFLRHLIDAKEGDVLLIAIMANIGEQIDKRRTMIVTINDCIAERDCNPLCTMFIVYHGQSFQLTTQGFPRC
jgi:preprotein translocase subunit SecA